MGHSIRRRKVGASDDAVASRLRDALTAVQDAGVPDELRHTALALAYLDLKANRGRDPEDANAAAGSQSGGGAGPANRLAAKLGVARDTVDRVYDFDDDGPHLVVSRRALSSSKAAAMRQVGQLVVAARQGAAIEAWTQIGVIRDECESRGVLDATNFATEVRKLDGHGIRIRGKGSDRELKMNQAGYEAAHELVASLVGGERQ
jgi:hypothetical protein